MALEIAAEKGLFSSQGRIGGERKSYILELGKIDGDLVTTKYEATATVSVYLGLHNRTSASSPDIETIYFYTGPKWSYKQDGQDCPKITADIADYKLRHLIRSPVDRLTKENWAQVKLVGEKVVASAWGGGEIKNKYRLMGRSTCVLSR